MSKQPKTPKAAKPAKNTQEANEAKKPGPKTGDKAATVECPYCGGKCHRKAVQKIKGEPKPYRRYYCVDGCGHYHYRDVDTNEIAEVGHGPRECKLHGGATEETKRLREQLKTANKTIEELKNQPAPVVGVIEKTIETRFEQDLATKLGIDAPSLVFTAKNDSGRPRALVNCLSATDIAALETEEDRDNVQQLHRALLTIQACIGVYRDRAQQAVKAAKGKIQ